MEHISSRIIGALKEQAEEPVHKIAPEAVKVVDDLFRILAEHTKYFRLNHGSQEDYNFRKREWVKTFSIAGIGENSVSRGVNRLRAKSGSFPSLTPGEFLALCAIAPEDINAPCVEGAYLEACRNSNPSEENKTWSHKAVRHAAHKTGSYFLRTESKGTTFPQFKENYLESCQMYFDGRILDQLESDKPQLKRGLEETKKTLSEGYEHLNSPKKALSALKDMLS